MFFCSHASEKVFKIRPRFQKAKVVFWIPKYFCTCLQNTREIDK